METGDNSAVSTRSETCNFMLDYDASSPFLVLEGGSF